MNVRFHIAQILNRENAKEQGFYDGRYRSRVVPDKKKTLYLKYRRNKNIEY